MVLKEEHFAAMQINWDDKIANMKTIAEEINIGMESFVFIDDDKLNREMIKGALPGVLVVDLPEDPAARTKLYEVFKYALEERQGLELERYTEEDALIFWWD